jgi:LysR family hydrogen peroxide-inducible transcriptional activator
VDINNLRYFVAVVEHQSFSKAAAHCNTSISNLSEQIQKLENRIGKILLDRSRRQIVPTVAGSILSRRARSILAQIEDVTLEIRAAEGASGGKVSIGVLPTFAPHFLAQILNSFIEGHPKIQMEVQETVTAQMLPMIEAGKLDMGITSQPIRGKGFEAETLFSEDLLLALHPHHPLARKRVIVKEDLISEKFIVAKDGYCNGGVPPWLCKRHNFSPRILFRGGQLETILSLVASGKGVSLIPQTAIISTAATIIYRRLEKPWPKRSIVVVTMNKRPLKTAAREFYDLLKQAGRAFNSPVANNNQVYQAPEWPAT